MYLLVITYYWLLFENDSLFILILLTIIKLFERKRDFWEKKILINRNFKKNIVLILV